MPIISPTAISPHRIGGAKNWSSYWAILNRVPIFITGSDAVETDQIVKVRLHYGSREGKPTNQDVFCDSLCRTDFADVGFITEDGQACEFWRSSYGNWEMIPIYKYQYIDASGNLWKADAGLYKSEDNGTTWVLKDADASGLIFVATNGYVYTSRAGGTIYRSTSDGASPALVLTLDTDASILMFASDEDSDGRLFFAQYQGANLATIYRSVDNGANWTKVLYIPDVGSEDDVIGTASPKGSAQHFHGLAVDPYTDYIYAGADAGGGSPDPGIALYRSADHGDSWTAVWDDDAADVVGFVFYDDHRLFGGEAGSPNGMVLTEDDSNYTAVVNRGLFFMLSKNGSTVIGGGSTVGSGSRYPQLLISSDEGYTWETFLMEAFENEAGFSLGHEYGGGSFKEFKTPTGGDKQLSIIADGDKYNTAILYTGITGRHEAEFYVKIPSLPIAGQFIYACFGGDKTYDATNYRKLYTSEVALTGLVARWKMNEGAGSSIVDSIGGHNGSIVNASWYGSSVEDIGTGRVPYISPVGDAIVLSGSGYVDIAGSDSHADFNFTKNFSITAWIITKDVESDYVVISKGDPTANNGWSLELYAAAFNPLIRFRYSSGAANTLVNAVTTAVIGRRNMIGIVIDNDATPNISFIVNGQLLSSTALSYEPISGTGPIVIGAYGNAGRTGKINATIGEVRIYKNKALSQNECQQIYEHRSIPATNVPAVSYIGLATNADEQFSRVDYSLITGATYYVGEYVYDGDGSAPGPALSASGKGAFNKLSSAITAASDGDGIIVLPGTYTEILDPGGKNVYIVSSGGVAETIIDGGGTQKCTIFDASETSACVIDGFWLKNGYGAAGGGLYINNASPTIKNVIVSECDCSALSGSKGGGLYIAASTSIFTNIVLIDNKVNITNGIGGNVDIVATASPVFNNMSCYGGSGVVANLQDYSSTSKYVNCIIWGGAGNPGFSTAPSGDRMTYSCVQKATGVYTGTGNINQDPLFTSATDLTLQTGSPCINTGTPVTGRTTDILDEDVDATPNMGAYE